MQCNKCHQDKDLTEFAWRNTKTQIRHAICKECHREMRRLYYQENKEAEIERLYKYRRDNYSKIISYLKEHPCVDCNEPDLVVLQFDHVRGKKIGNVSALCKHASWEKVEKEIKKCEVRCANCHIRKTAKQLNWAAKS